MKPATACGAVALVAVLLALGPAARAAEIDALITTAMGTAIVELLPSFERATGNAVHVSYGPSGGLARRFLAGAPADMIVVGSAVLDDLGKQGLLTGEHTDIARTAIGICIRKGAPRPDVSTPEALKRVLLAAKSVGYTAPAGGGVTAAPILHLFERLGIAAEIAPKAKLAAGGPDGRVSALVSSGEAEIGLQQVSELMSNPDVEVIGLLPADLQQITTYAAAVTARAREPAAARSLIEFLAGPGAAAVYKTKGLAL